MHPIILTLIISLAVQTIFFIFAAGFKTDKVTDLSYGLTFIIIAFYWLNRQAEINAPKLLVATMVGVWGVRLASYLFIRILKTKRDKRFDGIREKFWSFAKFWLLQGISVWVIMIPAVYFITQETFNPPLLWLISGGVIWLKGLLIETFADLQLFQFVNDPKNKGKWIDSGLWHYSRHPNYFGEILVWWGLFLIGVSTLSGSAWLIISGPLFITCLLLFVSGIPILEKNNDKKWGSDPNFQDYKNSTPVLIPWFKK